jgi:4-carboxymuconolactone decarboxylase
MDRRHGQETYLPEIYQRFRDENSSVAEAYAALAAACRAGGSLSAREQRLVKVGIAIGLNSEGGVRSHVRRGLAEGLGVEELRHAVVIAITTAGFPASVAAYKWATEVFDAEEGSDG